MRKPTIAKNYADALFELGERSGETERYAQLMNGFGAVLTEEPQIRVVLESPRVPKEKKLARSALSPARSAARGSSIMVPTR